MQTAAPRFERGRTTIRFWLRCAGFLVPSLLVLEIVCRYVVGGVPEHYIDVRYGRSIIPHERVVESTEGFSYGFTNELGNLDAPMPEVSPPDGILVLGDSFTEGRQVSRSERFTERLAARLRRRVYNVGHSGWSPLNAIGYFQAEAERFKPSTVIVQISGNDLDDVLEGQLRVTEPAPGVFAIAPRRARASSGRVARLPSALAQNMIVSVLRRHGHGELPEAGRPGLCEEIAPAALRALPWIAHELRALHRDVRILYLPFLDYRDGCSDRCRDANAAFRDAVEAAGMPYVDATAVICERFRQTAQPLHGFWNTRLGTGHLNEEGHAVVAALLEAHLEQGAGPEE